MHVIIETNRTTARIFLAVLDVENPEFKRKLDWMVEINEKLQVVGQSDNIAVVKNLKRVPLIAAFVSELLAAYVMHRPNLGRSILQSLSRSLYISVSCIS
ncbi:hypothetical protein RND81_05G177600 [Saponaria officinalis]|uniref:Uncharacterized protein n=1 Tax=Saponaria officinalis TaxID=3572 RepID=A0AAW1KTD6_SAPOF